MNKLIQSYFSKDYEQACKDYVESGERNFNLKTAKDIQDYIDSKNDYVCSYELYRFVGYSPNKAGKYIKEGLNFKMDEAITEHNNKIKQSNTSV